MRVNVMKNAEWFFVVVAREAYEVLKHFNI